MNTSTHSTLEQDGLQYLYRSNIEFGFYGTGSVSPARTFPAPHVASPKATAAPGLRDGIRAGRRRLESRPRPQSGSLKPPLRSGTQCPPGPPMPEPLSHR
nr:hypothetical protein GCM10010200_081990 [Actinomadura rugatobispora]